MNAKFRFLFVNRLPLLLGMALFLGFHASVSAAQESIWEQALNEFHQGEHAAAARSFQLFMDKEGPGPAAFYNLGLAQERAGDIPEAVASLLRARALDPSSVPIRTSLESLATKEGITLPVPGLAAKVVNITGAGVLWVAGSLLAWGGVALVIAGIVSTSLRKPMLIFGVLFLVLGKGVLAVGYFGDPLVAERSLSVVQGKDSPLRVTPVESAGAVENLKPGDIVEAVSRRGQWTYAVSMTGKQGWLPTEALLPVIPTGS